MRFGLHMVFQVLGALILLGMLGTFVAFQETSFLLTLGGFLLILAGALGGVESENKDERP